MVLRAIVTVGTSTTHDIPYVVWILVRASATNWKLAVLSDLVEGLRCAVWNRGGLMRVNVRWVSALVVSIGVCTLLPVAWEK